MHTAPLNGAFLLPHAYPHLKFSIFSAHPPVFPLFSLSLSLSLSLSFFPLFLFTYTGIVQRIVFSSCSTCKRRVFKKMPKETKTGEAKVSKRAAATPDKKRRSKKDPNTPKRGLSAYMFFSQECRDKVKAENPDAPFGNWLTRVPCPHPRNPDIWI